jgi:hypothetical protein
MSFARFIIVVAMCAGCAPGAFAPPKSTAAVSATATVQATGGTITYPGGGGFTTSFAYSANNAPSGTTATVTTITNPQVSLVPMDPPPGAMLIAYELTLNNDVKFNVWNGFLSSVVLPQAFQQPGNTFADYGYDLPVGVASGSDPGTVSGSTVSFPAGRFPVTLRANHTYLMVLVRSSP